MESGVTLFQNLSLNQFIIPELPLLKSNESWDETANITANLSFAGISSILGRFTCRYYTPEQKTILDNIIKNIKSKNSHNELKIELIHKSSYSGLPYQIYIEMIYEDNQKLEVYFDGFVFFMTTQKQVEANSLQELIKYTASELTFRKDCMDIVCKLFNLTVCSITNPFWDVEIKGIFPVQPIGVEYPAFKFICNDRGFKTFTNLGDKLLRKNGREYYIYFSENKKYIRERICHDRIIFHELSNFASFLEHENLLAINANSAFINSLKGIPGNILSFFKRHKTWKSLKDIPTQLLSIESMLPKYELLIQPLVNIMEYRTSYINTPRTISGEDPDMKILHQIEVEDFIQLEYNAENTDGFSILEVKSMQPLNTGIVAEIKYRINTLQKNLGHAVKNLNNVTTMYSTNFGFDALWVAIITLIVTIFLTELLM